MMHIKTLRVGAAAALFARHWRICALVGLSALLAGICLVGRPYILYDDSDPLTYIRKAWWLLGREGGYNHAFRGPGYPLFLIVTGMASLDTWWVLLPAQVLMAIVMPLFIYGIIAPVSRNGGFVAALLFMSYGAIYNHMNWIMSEELFLFVQFLGFFLASRYLFRLGGPRLLYGIALCFAYAVMVRPAASFYFAIFLATCLLWRVDNWRRYVGPFCVYAAIMMTWSIYDYYHGVAGYPTGFLPTTQAQRYFADLYYGKDYNLTIRFEPDITPESGPASRKVYEEVARHVAETRGHHVTPDPATARVLFDRFDDAALLKEMFSRPNDVYFAFIVEATQAPGVGGDSLLYQVAREHGHTGVLALARYLIAHPLIPIVGAPQTYTARLFMANFYRYSEMDASRYFFIGTLNHNLLAEDSGPASREFFQTLDRVVDMYPQTTFGDSNGYAEIFGSEERFRAYMRDPKAYTLPDGRSVLGMIEGSVYIWLTRYYGEEKTDRLMRQVAFETLRRHPAAGFLFFDNFLRVTIMRDFFVDYGDDNLSSAAGAWDYARPWKTKDNRSTVLPESLARHLIVATDHDNNISTAFWFQYNYLWRLFKAPAFFCMTLVIIPLMLGRRTAAPACFLILVYFYNVAALAIVIGSFDLPRWEDVGVFIPVIISVMGVCAIASRVRAMRESGVAGP